MSRETEDEQRHRVSAASDNDARVSCAASLAPEVPPRFLPRLFSLLAMPDADAAERGSETAPRRGRERRNRPFCSTWTLNAVAAAMHAAWFIVFVLLWALDENEDGSKRDVTYPLFYTSALFGKPPDPPAGLLVLDASGATDDGSQTLINPYPSCDAPRAARVGTMPVTPAFRDSHLVMSLHWLVASFFALSFLFQAAAAVADAFWFRARARRAPKKKNHDDVSASLFEPSSSEDDDDVARERTRAAIASTLRFVEYSFSAAVMVVAVALQVGLMDAWSLFALAALTWTTMMLGLVAERVLAVEERVAAVKARTEPSRTEKTEIDRENASKRDTSNGTGSTAGDDPRQKMRSETAAVASGLRVVRWTAHLTGWVTQGVVFVVIIAHFFASQRACEWEASTEKGNRRTDNVAPDFVYAVVFAELALFVGFGLTQTAQFVSFDRDVYSAGRKCRCRTCRCESRCGSKKKEKETENETERARCCCSATATAQYDRAARSRALARVEAAYVAQSFVSKTLLGWLTYTGNFA